MSCLKEALRELERVKDSSKLKVKHVVFGAPRGGASDVNGLMYTVPYIKYNNTTISHVIRYIPRKRKAYRNMYPIYKASLSFALE